MALTKWMAVTGVAVLISSVVGCSSGAGRAAEDRMDMYVEQRYPAGVIYLSSRDEMPIPLEFTPDGTHQKIEIVAQCTGDPEESAVISVTQDGIELTTLKTFCHREDRTGGIVPDLFNPGGGKVVLGISEEDTRNLALRAVGFTD